ncbi:Uncharacterised protein [Clostridium paraputrificum]|jgi:hypothetical protein|nr:Uncharacterised protein [Clostridium paraputrificum]
MLPLLISKVGEFKKWEEQNQEKKLNILRKG